jgi:hypothetical protein
MLADSRWRTAADEQALAWSAWREQAPNTQKARNSLVPIRAALLQATARSSRAVDERSTRDKTVTDACSDFTRRAGGHDAPFHSMKRQLISSEQSTPADKQLTKPCSDCPFARAALNGWLGKPSITEWLKAVHGESRIECHVHPNIQCAGAAIYRSNVCKRPRDESLLILPADRKLVFSTPMEFQEHHEKRPKIRRSKWMTSFPAHAPPQGCLGCNGEAVRSEMQRRGIDPKRFTETNDPESHYGWHDVRQCDDCGRHWVVQHA